MAQDRHRSLESSADGDAKAHAAQVVELQASVREAAITAERLRADIAALDAQRRQLDERLAAMQARDEVNGATMARLEQALRETETAREAAATDAAKTAEEVRAERSARVLDAAAAAKRIDDLRAAVAAAEATAASVETKRTATETALAAATAAAATQKQKAEALATELATTKDGAAAAVALADERSHGLEATRGDLARVTAELSRCREELGALKEQLAVAQDRHRSLESAADSDAKTHAEAIRVLELDRDAVLEKLRQDHIVTVAARDAIITGLRQSCASEIATVRAACEYELRNRDSAVAARLKRLDDAVTRDERSSLFLLECEYRAGIVLESCDTLLSTVFHVETSLRQAIVDESRRVDRAMQLINEVTPSLRGKTLACDRLSSALALLKTNSKLRPKAASTAGGGFTFSLNELDPKFRNIAWLVATRGGLVDALAELYNEVNVPVDSQLAHVPAAASTLQRHDRTVAKYTKLLGTFLSPIEKVHLGLPSYIHAMKEASREASDKELLRILHSSSHSRSVPTTAPKDGAAAMATSFAVNAEGRLEALPSTSSFGREEDSIADPAEPGSAVASPRADGSEASRRLTLTPSTSTSETPPVAVRHGPVMQASSAASRSSFIGGSFANPPPGVSRRVPPPPPSLGAKAPAGTGTSASPPSKSTPS